MKLRNHQQLRLSSFSSVKPYFRGSLPHFTTKSNGRKVRARMIPSNAWTMALLGLGTAWNRGHYIPHSSNLHFAAKLHYLFEKSREVHAGSLRRLFKSFLPSCSNSSYSLLPSFHARQQSLTSSCKMQSCYIKWTWRNRRLIFWIYNRFARKPIPSASMPTSDSQMQNLFHWKFLVCFTRYSQRIQIMQSRVEKGVKSSTADIVAFQSD